MTPPAAAAVVMRRAGRLRRRVALALLLAQAGVVAAATVDVAAGGQAACRLPRQRHPQRRPVRHGAGAARSGASRAGADQRPLRRRSGDGAAQVQRPGVPARRRPRTERGLGRGDDDAAVHAPQQPARHRLRRPARHRRLGAADLPGPGARDARRAVRSGSPVPPGDGVQGGIAEAAVHPQRKRSRPLHDLGRGAGPRRRAPRPRRRADRSRRRVVRHARRSRVPAPVPARRATQRARRRRPARHGAAGQLLARQPGGVRQPGRRLHAPSRRARATIPGWRRSSGHCCSRCRARSRWRNR